MEADVRVLLAVLLSTMVAGKVNGEEILVKGIGASFPREVYRAWIDVQLSTRRDFVDVNHDYESEGSSTGKRTILENSTEYQYAGTDVDFTDEEKQNPKYTKLYTLPTLAGAIVMAYNLPNLSSRLVLSREDIVGIYDGTITKWNDAKIVATNPGVILPDTAILPVVRQDGSGSTSTFTAALSSFSTDWKNRVVNGKPAAVFKSKDSWDTNVVKFSGLKNSGVAGLIASIENTIGYVSVSAAKDYDSIKMALVTNKLGNVTDPMDLPSLVAAMSVATNDLTSSIVDSPESGAYPLASNTYMVVRKHYKVCGVAVELLRYLHWVFFEKGDSDDEARAYFMVLPGVPVRNIIRDGILTKITCGTAKTSVWQQMILQKEEEEKRPDAWFIPVLILVPLLLLITGALLGYALYQRFKIWRMMNSNEWDIPIEDILFYFNSKNRNTNSKIRSNRSFTSMDSETWSQLEDGSAIVEQVLQWPGKWRGNTIGIRLLELKEFKSMGNKTKRMLLWMRDTIIHHNVLRFHGMTMVDNERYCVSEYCAKGPMLDILQDEKFNINNDIKFSLATDIVTGMAYLSSHGIVHGNLRSACCLVDSRWQVKISDWEYVHLFSTLKHTKRTPLRALEPNTDEIGEFAANYRQFWTAPEIIRNDYDLTPQTACDVYSFSIMLHEIFSREDPYSEHADAMEPKAIINAVVQNNLRPQHSEDTPVSIRQIMEIAWVDDSGARPSFDQIQKMLKHANPTKKNMLDSMLEAMEEYSIHLEDRVQERTSELQIAKEQAEGVLLNIMPTPIARKVLNQEDIEAREHSSIGIIAFELSIDKCCQDKDSASTIHLLSRIHSEMDALIKTKADTYRQQLFGDMVICLLGMTKRFNKKHVGRAAQLALELVEYLERLRTENPEMENLSARFGLHCGPVITGVIGQTSPQFVMYGDAIKCAVAMAYASQGNRILVSEHCGKVLQNTGRFNMEPAPAVELKNKQQMKASWLLSSDHVHPSSSQNNSLSDVSVSVPIAPEPEPETPEQIPEPEVVIPEPEMTAVQYKDSEGRLRNGFAPITAV